MPQSCWWEGTVVVDAKFQFQEKSGKPRTYWKMKVPANYQKKDSDKEWADWLWFEAWDDVANQCASFVKDDRVVVMGRVSSYQVEKDGKKEDKMKITVERAYKVAPNETSTGG